MKQFAVVLLFAVGCSNPAANKECVITSPTNGSYWNGKTVTWNDDAPATVIVTLHNRLINHQAEMLEIATNSETGTATLNTFPYTGPATITLTDTKGRSDQVDVNM